MTTLLFGIAATLGLYGLVFALLWIEHTRQKRKG